MSSVYKVTIGSDNAIQYQDLVGTNAGLLLNGPLEQSLVKLRNEYSA